MNTDINQLPEEIRHIKFIGIDDWNRPVFKVIEGNYYIGSVFTLFSWHDPKEKVIEYFKSNLDELCYFGEEYNCEPAGGNFKSNIRFILEE